MHPWVSTQYEGMPSIDVSARYFTPRKSVPYERGLAFEIGVDPDALLSQLRGQNYIHGSDNKVLYMQERKDEDGNITLASTMIPCDTEKRLFTFYSVERIDPAKFKVGDLVRASVSFVGFPTKDDKITMTIILKALTLLESLHTKVSTFNST